MYISSYLTLNTALSGVEAAQEELDTTGENITNANTADYEEQTVNLIESPSLPIAGSGADGAMQLGTGVNATGVVNSSDPYLDAAWRAQNGSSTAATVTQGYLQQIQSALHEPSSTGINAQLSQFWADWSSLSENPTSSAAQQAVIDDGTQLADSFNTLSSTLTGVTAADPTGPAVQSSILGQVNSQYQDIMAGPTGAGASGGSVYNDAYQIASLNYSIVQAQAAGQSANDLIDQRNAALDDLSSLGNVTVDRNSDGSVTVYFGGVTDPSGASNPGSAYALIQDPADASSGQPAPGDNFGSYPSTPGGTDGSGWAQAFDSQYGAATSAASLANSVGGTLGALIGLAGYSSAGFGSGGPPAGAPTGTAPAANLGTIWDLNVQLSNVAADLTQEVNNPQVTGGTGTIALSSPFFTPAATDENDAATIAVSSSLQSGTSSVQVSSLGTSSAGPYSSDNDVALDEAANTGGAADQDYQSLVQTVGSLAQGAKNAETTQSALQTQITNQRDSVEGVDLSQEMSNLISEQQAYEASAKVMNAFSVVMNSLMSVVGQ